MPYIIPPILSHRSRTTRQEQEVCLPRLIEWHVQALTIFCECFPPHKESHKLTDCNAVVNRVKLSKGRVLMRQCDIVLTLAFKGIRARIIQLFLTDLNSEPFRP